MDRVAELPKGVERTVKTDRTLTLTSKDLPWLPENESPRIAHLALVRLNGGKEFYYGSAHVGRLKDVASQMPMDKSDQAEALFWVGVQKFMQGEYIPHLDHPRSESPIYYVSNGRGAIRIYFLEMRASSGIPTVLRVAKCHSKGFEEDVYKEISTENIREIKKRFYG